MRCEIVIFFALSLWFMADSFDVDGSCKYHEICYKPFTVFGRQLSRPGICVRTDSCINVYKPWSKCTKHCGGGIRKRYGKCYSENCKKVVKEKEACNTHDCHPTRPPPPPEPTTPEPTSPPPPPPPTTPEPTSPPPPPPPTTPEPTRTPPPPPPTTPEPTPEPTTPEPTEPAGIDGMWSSWGGWSEFGECDMSCCGGMQTRTRTRTCTNPPQSGTGSDCVGDPTELESRACNTEDCPVSCVGITELTFFNDPCMACSRRYFFCTGGDEVTAMSLNCTNPNQVWNQMAQECQFNCTVPS